MHEQEYGTENEAIVGDYALVLKIFDLYKLNENEIAQQSESLLVDFFGTNTTSTKAANKLNLNALKIFKNYLRTLHFNYQNALLFLNK